MNHQTCDACGRELTAAGEVRYEVKIEVQAAYDPLALGAEDLAQDHRAAIARVLRQLEGLSTEEAQSQIYQVFTFDLCPACQRHYLRNLAAGALLTAEKAPPPTSLT